jgi:TetR/AcrR family transcriptional repressor of nem operon
MATMNSPAATLSTREKLLDQGVKLLMAQGYHGVGLQTILQTVGVPKGSFYHYFASKEAFSAEVIQHYIAPFISLLETHLSRPETTALQALDAYFQALIDESERRHFKGGCLLGNLMGEIGDTSERCREALHEAVTAYRDAFRDAIARGQSEGCFRTDQSAEKMADVLVNSWQGALLRMKIDLSVAPLQGCCEFLLHDYFRPTQTA